MSNSRTSVRLTMVTSPEDICREIPKVKRFNKVPLINFNFMWILRTILLAVIFSAVVLTSQFVVTHYFVHSVKVVGESMVPTLEENSKYLVDYWTLRNRGPQHNDIVVFQDPGDHGLSVKRVVAVEGESILFKDGLVFVNGRQLNEDYLMSNVRTFTYSQAKEQFITLGVGQYFLLGDNRPVSIDSRAYGPVNREDILGIVKVQDKFPL